MEWSLKNCCPGDFDVEFLLLLVQQGAVMELNGGLGTRRYKFACAIDISLLVPGSQIGWHSLAGW